MLLEYTDLNGSPVLLNPEHISYAYISTSERNIRCLYCMMMGDHTVAVPDPDGVALEQLRAWSDKNIRE